MAFGRHRCYRNGKHDSSKSANKRVIIADSEMAKPQYQDAMIYLLHQSSPLPMVEMVSPPLLGKEERVIITAVKEKRSGRLRRLIICKAGNNASWMNRINVCARERSSKSNVILSLIEFVITVDFVDPSRPFHAEARRPNQMPRTPPSVAGRRLLFECSWPLCCRNISQTQCARGGLCPEKFLLTIPN